MAMIIPKISRLVVPRVVVEVIEEPIANGKPIRRVGIEAEFNDEFMRGSGVGFRRIGFDGTEKISAVLPTAEGDFNFDPLHTVSLKFKSTIPATESMPKLDAHQIYLDGDSLGDSVRAAIKEFGVRLVFETNVGQFSPEESFKPAE